MRNALWAEWIIAKLTDRSRAASIVGDLLETTAQRGTLWFWLSVARIAVSLIWRRAIALVAAFYVGLFWRATFAILVLLRAGHTPVERYAFFWWDPREPLFSIMWFGAVLWIVAAYAAIRYGLRDKFAQLALEFCGLITIAMFYWRKPIIVMACITFALAILIASVRSAQRSRALMALTASLAFGFGGDLLSMYLRVELENLFDYPLSRSDLDRTIVNICFWLLAAWIATTVCTRMHDRLLRRDQEVSEIEPSN